MQINQTPTCRLYNKLDESIHHLFCLCEKSQTLWKAIMKWIKDKLNIHITIDNRTIILGYLLKNNYSIPLNTFIICTKAYIFKKAFYQGELIFSEILNKIKSTYLEQKSIPTINNKLTYFNKTWNVCCGLISS